MTHSERTIRRLDIAKAVASGEAIEDVAKSFNVKIGLVERAAKEHGIKIIRDPKLLSLPQSPIWNEVNWEMQDIAIARLIDVSRERVRQVRKALGKPRPKFHRAGKTSRLVVLWLEGNRNMAKNMTPTEICRALPVRTSSTFVRRVADRFGFSILSAKRVASILTKDNLSQMVAVDEATGCWNWLTSLQATGFGKIGSEYAHTIVFELFHGTLPAGKKCIHKCGNCGCVNPNHLFAGTLADSARIREAKFTGERFFGDNQKMSVSRAAEIRERFKAGETMKHIAKEAGVCYGTIANIVAGRSWKTPEIASA